MDWAGYIIAFLAGAISLELLWYERRRRKHNREELKMPALPELDYYECSSCNFKQATVDSLRCPYCYEPFIDKHGRYNAPDQGEKESK